VKKGAPLRPHFLRFAPDRNIRYDCTG